MKAPPHRRAAGYDGRRRARAARRRVTGWRRRPNQAALPQCGRGSCARLRMIFGAFERMVAFRYLRARRQEGFVSVIAIFSLLGIVLGVATLIIVMSVMNGFRTELIEPHPRPQRPSRGLWRRPLRSPISTRSRRRCAQVPGRRQRDAAGRRPGPGDEPGRRLGRAGARHPPRRHPRPQADRRPYRRRLARRFRRRRDRGRRPAGAAASGSRSAAGSR